MPYFDDENLREQENPGQVQISGASPTTDSDGNLSSENSGSGGNQKLVTGSGFQNLDQYLDKNQPKAFGQQFYGKVQGDIDSAKQKQGEASSQFENQVKESSQTPTSEQVNSAIANPTQANPQEFQKWEKQTYSGPHSLAESPSLYNQYWSGVNQAKTSSQLAGTEPGRFTLLDSYFGRPDYSFGQKSLDNLLVQQSGQNPKNLQSQAAQLQSSGDTQSKTLQNQASQAAGKVEQSRQGVQKAIGVDENGQVVTDPNAANYGALGQFQTQAQSDLTAANAQRAAEQASVKKALASGNLTPELAEKLGLTHETYYNLDPSQYLSNNADLNLSQTLTPEQRARIQALSQLAGTTNPYDQLEQSVSTDPYSFDKNRFTTDIQATGAKYQKDLNSAVQSVAQIAPLTGEYIRKIQAEGGTTNIPALIQALNKERQDWVAKNNGYTPQRIAAIDQSLNLLGGVLNQYKVNPETGGSQYLQSDTLLSDRGPGVYGKLNT